jgi:PKD repeat protein
MMLLQRAVERSRTLAWLAAAVLSVNAAAQPCDTTLLQGFTRTPIGPYLYQFTPDIDTFNYTVLGVQWQFSNGYPSMSGETYPIVEFPGEGYQLACITVFAEQQGQPCQSEACDLINIPPDTSGCGGVMNDFTIEYTDPDIVFISTSSSLNAIDQFLWDFGDGNSGTGPTITHAYAQFGAYYVCLTITSGNCTTTHCRWLYLGPAQLPCDTLADPAFEAIALNTTVAVIDATSASGMDVQVTWDFGDGNTAFGLTALHTYDFGGVYNICASVEVVGPLVQDSCVMTICQDVQVFDVTAATVDEAEQEALRVFPLPFEDEVHITWSVIERGMPWQVMDFTGRCVAQGTGDRSGMLDLDLSHVASGPLFIRMQLGDRPIIARLLKL